MPLLEVKDLNVRVEDREILHGLSLTVNKGEVHAIMGPNGSGKSTLSHVIAGKPGYEVTGGEILFNGEDLLAMSPDERSAKGVFLAFQYPVEIPGVATMTFLRTALNAQRKARGESEYSTPDFLKKVREVAKSLNIPQDMLKRGVNVGFSGGEKKRNEDLQMALFEPSLCVRARPAARCGQGRRRPRAGVRGLRAHRTSQPAHRGMEIHRSARADARSASARAGTGRCCDCTRAKSIEVPGDRRRVETCPRG